MPRLSRLNGLFNRWYPRLVSAARRRLGDSDDAEDIAQEAFIRLLGEAPDNPPAWLFTVAGRLVSDYRRAGSRRDRVVQRPPVQMVPDELTRDPAQDIVRAEVIATVRAVLATMSDRDRQLLLLHHYGLSYREIATRLGVATSSVGSLLTRAHRRFLAAYETQHDATAEVPSDATPARVVER
jgi:RNA polymerase sigma factor (sigma-70 family)